MALDLDRLRDYKERLEERRSLKIARIRAHAEFDKLWKQGYMSRGRAYAWLAREFGRDEVHMAWMDEDECARVVELVDELLRDLNGLPRAG